MASQYKGTGQPATSTHWRHIAQRADWDVTTASRQLGISVRQLERLCQEQLGLTPRECFLRERMDEAARLLSTGQTVKGVAMHLGYTQPANFSRDFKLRFGRSARAFTPRIGLPPPLPPPEKPL